MLYYWIPSLVENDFESIKHWQTKHCANIANIGNQIGYCANIANVGNKRSKSFCSVRCVIHTYNSGVWVVEAGRSGHTRLGCTATSRPVWATWGLVSKTVDTLRPSSTLFLLLHKTEKESLFLLSPHEMRKRWSDLLTGFLNGKGSDLCSRMFLRGRGDGSARKRAYYVKHPNALQSQGWGEDAGCSLPSQTSLTLEL